MPSNRIDDTPSPIFSMDLESTPELTPDTPAAPLFTQMPLPFRSHAGSPAPIGATLPPMVPRQLTYGLPMPARPPIRAPLRFGSPLRPAAPMISPPPLGLELTGVAQLPSAATVVPADHAAQQSQVTEILGMPAAARAGAMIDFLDGVSRGNLAIEPRNRLLPAIMALQNPRDLTETAVRYGQKTNYWPSELRGMLVASLVNTAPTTLSAQGYAALVPGLGAFDGSQRRHIVAVLLRAAPETLNDAFRPVFEALSGSGELLDLPQHAAVVARLGDNPTTGTVLRDINPGLSALGFQMP